MTPEEKAKELIEKFRGHVRNDNPPLPNATGRSKACALICASEILNELVPADFISKDAYNELKNYWQSVKEYINQIK